MTKKPKAKQKKKSNAIKLLSHSAVDLSSDILLSDIRSFIEKSRKAVAVAINADLVALYWSIGTRIRKDILLEKRAEYGEKIVHALSAQLLVEYGQGFGKRNWTAPLRSR